MASLQARSSLRSAHPLLFVNKLVSLTAFIILLGSGWVAVSYLKNEVMSRWHTPSSDNRTSATPNNTGVRISDASVPETKPLASPVRLVYSCAEDKEFYHASTHLQKQCQRTALAEEAALRRGLKHCPICLPE